MEQVDELQRRGRIQGTALTLDEMLNPIEEDCVGETGFEFLGGDQDILSRVAWRADAEEVEESEDDEGEPSSNVCVINLQTQVQKIQAHFHHLNDWSHMQTSLNQFWTKTPANKEVSMV